MSGIPFLHPIDLNGLELKNAKFHVLSSVPLLLVEALHWYKDGRIQVYDAVGVKTVAYLSDLGASSDHASKIDNPHQTSDVNLKVTDVTDNNVSTLKHGLAPKLPNDDTKFLNGKGNYTTPPVTPLVTFGDIYAANTLLSC